MEIPKPLEVPEITWSTLPHFSSLHSIYSSPGTSLNALSYLKISFITVVQCFEVGIFSPRT